jgi:hypothetical protein
MVLEADIRRFWRRKPSADRVEAQAIAERVGSRATRRAPDALRTLADVPDRFEEVGARGTVCQVVVEAWTEDRSGNVLRVCVSVDGGRVSAVFPVGWSDTVTLTD